MKCFLVHGYNTFDGGASGVLQFVKQLEAAGLEPVPFQYGWTGLLGVRFFNDDRARQLRRLVGNEQAVAICHSNGCTVGLMAAAFGAPFRNMVFLNPALDTDAIRPIHVGRIDVFHNGDDVATLISSLLLFHPWGSMGRRGYRGKDPGWINWDTIRGERWQWEENLKRRTATILSTFDSRVAAHGHSGWMPKNNRQAWQFWSPLIVGAAAGRLG